MILSCLPRRHLLFCHWCLLCIFQVPAVKRHNEVQADLNALKYVNKEYLIDGLKRISEIDKIPEIGILYLACPFDLIPRDSIFQ